MNSICFVTSIVNSGSVGTYTKELLQRFVNNYEMHLITGDNISLNNVIVHKRPFVNSSKFGWIINNSLNTLYSLSIKKKYNIDILHTQFLISLYTDIVTMHGCIKALYKKDTISSAKVSTIKLYTELVVENRIINTSKKIISVSEGLKRDLLKYYRVSPEKICVIPNCVNINKFKPNYKKRIRIRKLLKVNENNILLIFSGWDFKRKGLPEIIKSLSKIKKNTKLIAFNLKVYHI